MSEQTTIDQETTTIEQQQTLANPFSEESWIDPSVNVSDTQIQSQESSQTETQSQNPKSASTNSDEEIYDADEYLKQKLGFDNWETAAQEIERLKSSPKIDFENETSKKFYEYAKEQKEDELLNFLQEKKKLDRLATSEIKNASVAEEIVKLSMYQKNKDLDQSEIDFLFNEKFQKPAKPEQRLDELDSEFEERVSAWESRINEVEKRLVIEAKLAKPELEKLKSSLVLPDINPKEVQPEITPEVLEAQKKYMDNYFGSVNEVINSFEGFTATVKDEGADFNVAYVPSDEEKQAVAQQMKYFAENNLDANMLFADRWVNEDGTINTKQMAKDLFLLQNEGKITQKYVNDAANKRLAMHLKKQSNINFGNSDQGTFTPDNRQSEMDKLAAIMFAK
jgi:hypothetical protein